jgi:GNAT superfamily N-acetyltransferase
MKLSIKFAVESDAPELTALRNRASRDLADRFGLHPSCVTEQSVLRGIKTSRVLALCNARGMVGALRLATKKPWAINTAYFESAHLPLYLHDLAVDPAQQDKGFGRRLVEEASAAARAWPSGAIRLDAYDAPYGAGGFYEKCGFHEVGRVTYRMTPLIYYERLIMHESAAPNWASSAPQGRRATHRAKVALASKQD